MTRHTPEQAAILSLLDQVQALQDEVRRLTGVQHAQAVRIGHLESATLALADAAAEQAMRRPPKARLFLPDLVIRQ